MRKSWQGHDQLEAHVRCPQGDEQSAHTLPERTQGNIVEDLNSSYMHRPTTRTICRHPFVNRIMEAGIPLGWKPLNLERYDETTDPNEHLDAFLTQVNLYTNDNATLCRVFPTSLKGATSTWYDRLPPRSIDIFDTLVEWLSAQYTTNRSHRMTSAA